MIPDAAITEWSVGAPWPTRGQVEQDLLLSRLIVELASDPYLRDELIFRGGTCLHKMHLPLARRYSEDLDYVRASAGGIQPFTQAVTKVGETLGFDVRTQMSAQPKAYLRTTATSGERLRIKVEVNTYERMPALPLMRVAHDVRSSWFSGSAEVQTFAPAELVATKIRALYQRKKGRDLFDLWLALTEMQLAGEDIVAAFAPYRPGDLTARMAIENLRRKLNDADFRDDLVPLVATWPPDYNIDRAAALVIAEVLERL